MKVGSHIGMPWLKLDLNRAEGGFKGEECEGGEAGCVPYYCPPNHFCQLVVPPLLPSKLLLPTSSTPTTAQQTPSANEWSPTTVQVPSQLLLLLPFH